MATISTTEPELATDPSVSGDPFFEVIDGKPIEKADMGTYPTEIATILAAYMSPQARVGGHGRVIVEALFRIDAKSQYRPDVAFVSFKKWPKGRRTPITDPWDLIPDLAVEVISKSDPATDVLAKVRHYFGAGVRAVWVVYPTLEVIHVFDSYTRIRVLTRLDELDGGEIIPGFRLPLASLFEEETEAEGEASGPIA